MIDERTDGETQAATAPSGGNDTHSTRCERAATGGGGSFVCEVNSLTEGQQDGRMEEGGRLKGIGKGRREEGRNRSSWKFPAKGGGGWIMPLRKRLSAQIGADGNESGCVCHGNRAADHIIAAVIDRLTDSLTD